MRCLIKTLCLLSISYLYLIYTYIVLSFVSSLSLGVLMLVYFTPYRLAPILVSKSAGIGDSTLAFLRLISKSRSIYIHWTIVNRYYIMSCFPKSHVVFFKIVLRRVVICDSITLYFLIFLQRNYLVGWLCDDISIRCIDWWFSEMGMCWNSYKLIFLGRGLSMF